MMPLLCLSFVTVSQMTVSSHDQMFQKLFTRGLYRAISWLAPNATSPLRPQEAAWVVRLQPIEMCSLEMWGMSIAKVKGLQRKSGLLYFSLLVTPTEC